MNWTMVITILGGLSLFLYGMKVMSEGLQKVAGDKLRVTLQKLTNNRLSGVFTGFFITTAVQSSSASTVMLISFVNAGLITFTQSLGVIMGANIGTTVTGWIVALVGLKININIFALPAISIGFFVRFLNKQRLTDWGEVLLGFGLLFLGLTLMRDAVGDFKDAPEILNLMGSFRATDIPSTLLVIAVGTLVTMLIQSSSATMAITLTLASQNIIDFQTCAALILGENIGTTITANLAAIGASTAARRAARAHLVFNVLGVVWMLFVFQQFLTLVDMIVPGNVYSTLPGETGRVLPDHLAAFHTLFNVINTLIFLPLTGFLAWSAMQLTAKPHGQEEQHLTYLSSALVSTPPLAIEETKRELSRMSATVLSMLDQSMELFNKNEKTQQDFYSATQNIISLETLTDNLEREISAFMVRVIRHSSSGDLSEEISEILDITSNLERIGDHCELLMKLQNRLNGQNLTFTESAREDINGIAAKAREMLVLINDNVMARKTNIMTSAQGLEAIINQMRSDLRMSHINRLNEGTCGIEQGLVFLDMLSSFEKIGDHAYNIAEAISGI
jgi:phosphate:Na+ symporter